ncbi:nitroreductase family protein [Ectothiorhodospira mobilis]|uniref:nitroreductase family protein n=1 Tax=Ectothiorhodospira mobilis TaxID=195064 RepID=UPI001903B0E2|nr:nitroreductase family protein [Ectothiorhodospira mobilis]MBK1692968.1 nitroreductase-like protein [Ectothiorhodospira mobilis]
MISNLRDVLPPPIKYAVNRFVDAIITASGRIFSANRWLANLYYFLLSRRFDREHLAVLKGRAAYYRALCEMGDTSPLLRRNVHRLEKGLIMQPRRNVFAEAFILETVHCYNCAKGRPTYSQDELRWATDVLDEYFSVVEDTPPIRKARKEYSGEGAESKPRADIDPCTFKPYPLSACPETDVSFEQLATLFLRRRSVRWYKQEPVPPELIQQAINVAALAPSACNRQPYRFIVANDPSRATEIAECAGGTTGFAHQIPVIIIVVGDLSAYPKERDRHLIYIDASLASMQLMLAAETLGLSTCPINWPDVDWSERRLQGILDLPGYERVVMLISIGYGDLASGIPYSQKKQNELITQWCAEK